MKEMLVCLIIGDLYQLPCNFHQTFECAEGFLHKNM
uniref:Uncharacterized protein n=1 Tax=Rhizophora mucronata TaxID=61149 RepID=A0A2P2NI50_RHIMU